MGIYFDTDLNKGDVKFLILLFTGLWIIYLPVWCMVKLMKIIFRSISGSVDKRRMSAKVNRFDKDLRENLQDYEDGHITAEELNEIVRDYDSRNGRISVKLTRLQPKGK